MHIKKFTKRVSSRPYIGACHVHHLNMVWDRTSQVVQYGVNGASDQANSDDRRILVQVEHAYERSMSPDILALIASRHSKRSFTSRPVSRDILKAVLTAATNAPSSQNNQPWQVAVVTGARRDQLSAALCDAFDQGVAPTPDYLNRPKQLPPELQQRCEDYGRDFLTFKGIARDDAEGRHQHRRDNFLFYGAPVEMIFHLPANAAAGTFLDLGFFMQNVILGLEGYGLASCPQYSVASYSDVVRHHLGLSPSGLWSISHQYFDSMAHTHHMLISVELRFEIRRSLCASAFFLTRVRPSSCQPYDHWTPH